MPPNYRLTMAYPTACTLAIAAPAQKVWALVADLPRMGEWSPENAGGTWVKGATGPALGAVFKGTNRNGLRRWSTTVTVVACEPGKAFEFAVTSGPLAVASWRYDFEKTDAGCRVTESWVDQRTRWFATVARLMGDHSAEHAQREMTATLARLAAVAEERPDEDRLRRSGGFSR
jgi:Polyketide cyclase / dehydrase and lipid transport